jgi:hypothetical protein
MAQEFKTTSRQLPVGEQPNNFPASTYPEIVPEKHHVHDSVYNASNPFPDST